jgi:hypothetical protein
LARQIIQEQVKAAFAAHRISTRRLQRVAYRGQPPLKPRAHGVIDSCGCKHALRRCQSLREGLCQSLREVSLVAACRGTRWIRPAVPEIIICGHLSSRHPHIRSGS